MRSINRLIATATALVAIGSVLIGCTAAVTPDVSFPAEKLTISLPRMIVGQAFSATLPEAMGGKEGLVYSLAPDVPGLTFDADTRVLSGTPATSGTYDMTYTAKDPATGGTMESVKFRIVIDAMPLMNKDRIIGTWENTSYWSEDDGREGIWIDFLTFTKTRFILVRSHFFTDGALHDAWVHRGTWEITDHEISRIWYHNHDDNDDTEDVLARLPKRYLLDGDDTLIITSWADEHGGDTSSDWMTRVVDSALSLPPVGVWRMEWYGDDGRYAIDTMALESDGAFTWSEERPHGTWTLTAEWEVDIGNYYINLTNATETWTDTGGEPKPHDRIRNAKFLRFAYAPMMDERGKRTIRVSSWGDELDPRGEYGGYWRQMTLQR